MDSVVCNGWHISLSYIFFLIFHFVHSIFYHLFIYELFAKMAAIDNFAIVGNLRVYHSVPTYIVLATLGTEDVVSHELSSSE